MDVAVDVIVDVIDIVIVAVHVNGNDTVIVIATVDTVDDVRRSETSAPSTSSDHGHGGVHVHVNDHGPDHVNVNLDDHGWPLICDEVYYGTMVAVIVSAG